LQGTELRGKQLGIVGLGRIGMEVGKRALGMGMTVLAYDPYVAESAARSANITLRPLEEVLENSDYVSLHLGLTPETQGLIRDESLAKMKPGVRIINCARGELVDDASLLRALESGHVAGAALDVFSVEPPPKNNPLLRHANVIATPHIAGSTHEAQEAVGVQIAQQVCEYLRQSVVQNAVNVPSLSDLEYRRLKPYLHLTERLARLLSFLIDGNLQEVQISVSDPLKDLNAKLLRSYAVMGVLQGKSQDAINVVNADAIARQRGITVSVAVLPEALADDHVIGARLQSSKKSVKALGTVVRGTQARIIGLDGCEIDSPLEGCLLVVRNDDVPGVIGSLGTVLGQHGINIAHFSLGRRAETAVGIVQSDAALGMNAMAAVRRIAHIREAHTFAF
jgi:D-3-phosphoglycerate dehydrogenase